MHTPWTTLIYYITGLKPKLKCTDPLSNKSDCYRITFVYVICCKTDILSWYFIKALFQRSWVYVMIGTLALQNQILSMFCEKITALFFPLLALSKSINKLYNSNLPFMHYKTWFPQTAFSTDTTSCKAYQCFSFVTGGAVSTEGWRTWQNHRPARPAEEVLWRAA